MGPVVGGDNGLPRDEYLTAVGGFDITAAFPDLQPRFHHFRTDPLDPGRIWFTSTASGSDTGTGFLGNKPSGKQWQAPGSVPVSLEPALGTPLPVRPAAQAHHRAEPNSQRAGHAAVSSGWN